MTVNWIQALLTMGLQHLWQSALLLLFVAVVLRRSRISADARSWILLGAFVLAATSPLLVLLPGTTASVDARLQAPAAEGVTAPTAAVPAMQPETVPVSPGSNAGPGTSLLPAIALVWLLGTLWQLARLLQAWQQARRLHRTATVSPALEAALRWTLPAGTRIALSNAAPGPMVVGLLKPRILIPPRLVETLSPEALRDLLLHEAAHIHRRDLWVSAAQRVVLAVYWWSPFLKQLGIRLDLMREMACDERAARQSRGGNHYAGSLLAAVSGLMQHPGRALPLAVGMSGQRGGLAQRVDGLLAMDAQRVAPATRLAWGALCLIVLAAHVGVSLAATPRLGTATTPVPATASVAAARPYTSTQVEQLIEAATTGNTAQVQRLIDTGVPVDARQRGDGSALIAASRHGQLAMVDYLLTRGASADLPSRGDGNPLIVAAAHGQLRVVERLVAAGANIDRIVAGDETPLINAARSGHLGTVSYLVEQGADVNLGVVADRRQWRSPLNQARDPAVRAYLVQHGAVADRR